MDEIKVDKSKFDEVLRKLTAAKPMTFREVAKKPKSKKGGGVKRSKSVQKQEES